jgi:lipopolysaccharide/colanic/teichoic acid biosynthesis glycosyltransferase
VYIRFIKPGFDGLTALVVFFFLLPFLVPIALILSLSTGQNPFFRQQRIGYQGALFWLYKFRTMTNVCDKHGNLLPDADRTTPFGHYLRLSSIDELPQLINVLLGHMSLVGPRPLLAANAPVLAAHNRHSLKPGLTGWAQIHGRNHLSWDEKFALDGWYIGHCRFFVDCLILWRTLFVLIDDSPPAKPYIPCYSTEREATPAS